MREPCDGSQSVGMRNEKGKRLRVPADAEPLVGHCARARGLHGECESAVRQTHTLADVGFEHAEGLFVPLQSHGQGAPQTLCGEVVEDDPVSYADFDLAGCVRRGVETEVEDKFFGGAGDAAKVCIASMGIGVIDDDFLNLLVFVGAGFFLGRFAHWFILRVGLKGKGKEEVS